MTKALLSVVVTPMSPDVKSWSGLTPLEVAAAQGHTKVMDILVKQGAAAPKSILVAACVGKAYTGESVCVCVCMYMCVRERQKDRQTEKLR